jgi:hypothetical protein
MSTPFASLKVTWENSEPPWASAFSSFSTLILEGGKGP